MGVGRFCEIIVGTHSLVSTPSERVKPFRLGSGLPQGVSPNSPDYCPNITAGRTEIQSFALPLSYLGFATLSWTDGDSAATRLVFRLGGLATGSRSRSSTNSRDIAPPFSSPGNANCCIACGPTGIRTPDLRVANAALYQLSYRPEF